MRNRQFLVLVAMLFSGCAFRAAPPNEFAGYSRGLIFKGALRAVSPEGVVFSVRKQKNKPFTDLNYWRKAMKTRMGDAGYRVLADSVCMMSGEPGALLKLAAPVGNTDYLYWIAITLSGKKILVAEVAGEVKPFLARTADIENAISALAW